MRVMAAFVAFGVLVAACGSSSSGGGGTVDTASGTVRFPAGAQLASVKVARATPDAAAARSLVAANQRFAWDLYRVLAARNAGKNLFFSPQSIATALAMVDAGARGETDAQIRHALHADALPGDQLHGAFNALAQALLRARTSHDNGRKPLELSLADSAWGERSLAFRRVFLDTLARYYGAGLRLADFQHDAEHERRRINAWVADQTEGRIKELLPEGILDDATVLVLVDTITFTGDWRQAFRKDRTTPQSFVRLDGSTVDVPMMSARAPLGATTALDGDGWTAARLPYAGGASMTVIVPIDGEFAAVEAKLGAGLLADVDRHLQTDGAIIELPKFAFRMHASLKDALGDLGVRDAFANADLSGIAGGPGDIVLKDVVHEAMVKVDENGTKAAAATAGIAELTSLPPTFSANRPFLFVIRDDATNAVLFAGRVLDPTAA